MSAHFRLQPTIPRSKSLQNDVVPTVLILNAYMEAADLSQTFVVSCSRCWRPSHVGLILSSPDRSARSLSTKATSNYIIFLLLIFAYLQQSLLLEFPNFRHIQLFFKGRIDLNMADS
ncbi:hypothetical protein L596_000514 [Steinernema carpocapsae]|uniref:Uncharacterized protein n=1 Tax=Steinernema carpocapsae TaxID=34508 RepID=A0A4U8UKQ1_STECR|nr:hypothetical protein L596_000514 [Steinernema carpocapsae]